MKKNSSICIVSPSFKIGGAERTLTNLANFFINKGFIVTFISCNSGSQYYTIDERIKIIAPTFTRKQGKINKLIYYFRLVLFIRIKLKATKPDRILVMADIYNPIVLLAARGLNISVFIGDITKPDRKFNFIVRLGKKIFYPYCSGFIAQTHSAADFYRKKFSDKLNIKVINGAVKDVRLHNVPKKNLIISVGRLSIEKGPDRLIKAYKILKNKKDWKLAFTGGGPMLNELQIIVKELKIENDVLFLGKVDDVDLLYSEARIFVLPSRMEGFPNALCEAMAAGLPCICFDSFPSNEIITDGVDGIILKDGNVEGLAQTIDRLIENKRERKHLGQNAMKIRSKLSINKIGSNFIDFMFMDK